MGDLDGRTALVTGASSGLGVEFARQLAARGAGLALSARRTDRLEALARELAAAHGIETRVFPADLADPGGPAALHAAVREAGLEVEVLVNNAGHGAHGDFADLDWETLHAQVRLNAVSVLELSHLFGKEMRERGRGHILNVGSFGSIVPVPGYAVYSSAKALVLHVSQGLAEELRGSGVRVCCTCPGGMKTEFFEVNGHEVSTPVRLAMMEAGPVARASLRALFAGKTVVFPGATYKLSALMVRLMPRRFLAASSGQMMG